jgi:hypothetical protein
MGKGSGRDGGRDGLEQANEVGGGDADVEATAAAADVHDSHVASTTVGSPRR